MNPDELVADCERRLGRKLTAGEKNVDLVSAVAVLETGKERLRQAIQAELRATLRELLRTGRYPYLDETPAMLSALRALYDAGTVAAYGEIARFGQKIRAYADEPPILTDLRGRLADLRLRISLRAHREAASAASSGYIAELSPFSGAALRALERRVPGALDAASRLVSPAFFGGIGDVYSVNADLFDGWEYSAVLDAATCDICRAADGQRFASWDEAIVVLPNGGPNPACRGDGRCRCRLVPTAPGDVVESPTLPAPLPAEPLAPLNAGNQQAVALARVGYETEFAQAHGISIEEWREQAEQAVRAAVSGSEVRKRTHLQGLEGILADGRVKSQFEVGYSRGLFNPDFRAQEEAAMFGYARDLDPSKRPIYGYLSATSESGSVTHYGDVVLRLRDEVRGRTTFTLADSLGSAGTGEAMAPAPLLEPTRLATRMPGGGDPVRHLLAAGPERVAAGDAGAIELLRSRIVDGYAEAQIHGGLAVDDIVEVVFTRHRTPEALDQIVSDFEQRLAKADLPPDAPGFYPLGPGDRAIIESQLAGVREEQEAFRRITAELDRRGIPWRTSEGYSP